MDKRDMLACIKIEIEKLRAVHALLQTDEAAGRRAFEKLKLEQNPAGKPN